MTKQNRQCKVKICGITNLPDAQYAIELGADALGFNFYKKSKRYIEPKKAAEIISQLNSNIDMIGVFVNATLDEITAIAKTCSLDTAQLHGDETKEFCQSVKDTGLRVIKAVRVKSPADIAETLTFPADAILLDAYSTKDIGGTGESFTWDWVKPFIAEKIYLAGGINPNNAKQATELGVYAIDICSGIEATPGTKDHNQMRKLFDAIKT